MSFLLSSKCFSFFLLFLSLSNLSAAADVDPTSWMDTNPSIYNPPPDDNPPYSSSSDAVTSTVQDRPVITTIEMPYSTSTASADDGNVKAGDLIAVLSPSFRSHVLDVAKTACKLPRKRSNVARAASCDMDAFLQGTIGDGAPGGLDIISFNKPVITGHDVEALIRKFFAAKKALFKSRIFIGGLCVVALGMIVENVKTNLDGPIHIPKGDLGDPTGAVASTLPQVTDPPESSSRSCKRTKSGTETPICKDVQVCNGWAHGTCEVDNDDLHCPCANMVSPKTHSVDPSWIDQANNILQTILNSPAPTPTAQCVYDQDAHHTQSPTEWCNCDVSKTYAVASDTNSPCPPDVTKGTPITRSSISTSSPQPAPSSPPPPTCYKSGGPNYQIDRTQFADLATQYCKKKMGEQAAPGARGNQVAPNWPGSCAWSTDAKKKDPNTLAATFSVKASGCPQGTPRLVQTVCENSFFQIFDSCPSAPNTDAKFGGSWTVDCITYQVGVLPMGLTGLNIDLNPGGNC